jgi:hypothetical protein
MSHIPDIYNVQENKDFYERYNDDINNSNSEEEEKIKKTKFFKPVRFSEKKNQYKLFDDFSRNTNRLDRLDRLDHAKTQVPDIYSESKDSYQQYEDIDANNDDANNDDIYVTDKIDQIITKSQQIITETKNKIKSSTDSSEKKERGRPKSYESYEPSEPLKSRLKEYNSLLKSKKVAETKIPFNLTPLLLPKKNKLRTRSSIVAMPKIEFKKSEELNLDIELDELKTMLKTFTESMTIETIKLEKIFKNKECIKSKYENLIKSQKKYINMMKDDIIKEKKVYESVGIDQKEKEKLDKLESEYKSKIPKFNEELIKLKNEKDEEEYKYALQEIAHKNIELKIDSIKKKIEEKEKIEKSEKEKREKEANEKQAKDEKEANEKQAKDEALAKKQKTHHDMVEQLKLSHPKCYSIDNYVQKIGIVLNISTASFMNVSFQLLFAMGDIRKKIFNYFGEDVIINKLQELFRNMCSYSPAKDDIELQLLRNFAVTQNIEKLYDFKKHTFNELIMGTVHGIKEYNTTDFLEKMLHHIQYLIYKSTKEYYDRSKNDTALVLEIEKTPTYYADNLAPYIVFLKHNNDCYAATTKKKLEKSELNLVSERCNILHIKSPIDSLQEYIDKIQEINYLDTIQKCKVLQTDSSQGTKSEFMLSDNKYLIFQFDRFTFKKDATTGKIQESTITKTNQSFEWNESIVINGFKYNLIGLIIFTGNNFGDGHYYYYKISRIGKKIRYYKYNDEWSEITNRDTYNRDVNQNGYIALYVRDHQPKLYLTHYKKSVNEKIVSEKKKLEQIVAVGEIKHDKYTATLKYNPYNYNETKSDYQKSDYYSYIGMSSSDQIMFTNGMNHTYVSGEGGTNNAITELGKTLYGDKETFFGTGSDFSIIHKNEVKIEGINYNGDEQSVTIDKIKYFPGSVFLKKPMGLKKKTGSSDIMNIAGIYHIKAIAWTKLSSTKDDEIKSAHIVYTYISKIIQDFCKNQTATYLHIAGIPGELYGGTEKSLQPIVLAINYKNNYTNLTRPITIIIGFTLDKLPYRNAEGLANEYKKEIGDAYMKAEEEANAEEEAEEHAKIIAAQLETDGSKKEKTRMDEIKKKVDKLLPIPTSRQCVNIDVILKMNEYIEKIKDKSSHLHCITFQHCPYNEFDDSTNLEKTEFYTKIDAQNGDTIMLTNGMSKTHDTNPCTNNPIIANIGFTKKGNKNFYFGLLEQPIYVNPIDITSPDQIKQQVTVYSNKYSAGSVFLNKMSDIIDIGSTNDNIVGVYHINPIDWSMIDNFDRTTQSNGSEKNLYQIVYNYMSAILQHFSKNEKADILYISDMPDYIFKNTDITRQFMLAALFDINNYKYLERKIKIVIGFTINSFRQINGLKSSDQHFDLYPELYESDKFNLPIDDKKSVTYFDDDDHIDDASIKKVFDIQSIIEKGTYNICSELNVVNNKSGHRGQSRQSGHRGQSRQSGHRGQSRQLVHRGQSRQLVKRNSRGNNNKYTPLSGGKCTGTHKALLWSLKPYKDTTGKFKNLFSDESFYTTINQKLFKTNPQIMIVNSLNGTTYGSVNGTTLNQLDSSRQITILGELLHNDREFYFNKKTAIDSVYHNDTLLLDITNTKQITINRIQYNAGSVLYQTTEPNITNAPNINIGGIYHLNAMDWTKYKYDEIKSYSLVKKYIHQILNHFIKETKGDILYIPQIGISPEDSTITAQLIMLTLVKISDYNIDFLNRDIMIILGFNLNGTTDTKIKPNNYTITKRQSHCFMKSNTSELKIKIDKIISDGLYTFKIDVHTVKFVQPKITLNDFILKKSRNQTISEYYDGLADDAIDGVMPDNIMFVLPYPTENNVVDTMVSNVYGQNIKLTLQSTDKIREDDSYKIKTFKLSSDNYIIISDTDKQNTGTVLLKMLPSNLNITDKSNIEGIYNIYVDDQYIDEHIDKKKTCDIIINFIKIIIKDFCGMADIKILCITNIPKMNKYDDFTKQSILTALFNEDFYKDLNRDITIIIDFKLDFKLINDDTEYEYIEGSYSDYIHDHPLPIVTKPVVAAAVAPVKAAAQVAAAVAPVKAAAQVAAVAPVKAAAQVPTPAAVEVAVTAAAPTPTPAAVEVAVTAAAPAATATTPVAPVVDTQASASTPAQSAAALLLNTNTLTPGLWADAAENEPTPGTQNTQTTHTNITQTSQTPHKHHTQTSHKHHTNTTHKHHTNPQTPKTPQTPKKNHKRQKKPQTPKKP